ncbi:hypothetical protein NAEGRDRAFT_59674 [Naegleria gruberi]|uniref:Uncharacterized protein n=1 Tax=Naegleria gruberi TaxID=5762 RepID=D2VZG0_NAEGR|nr:uncharacterized protein NAEGRDRAFT_59674 [Naegleria gruberi]EFC37785.1 hypothetical protein NAEGRDRAFT_59674 [Naegleria gruberi]|eukprot:XP_002670529.1 hypothetical protein NAEGRDRAFT_59674 [Naegleria gruberi strain NEG-M]
MGNRHLKAKSISNKIAPSEQIQIANIHDKSYSSSLSESLEFTHLLSMGSNDKGQLGRNLFKEDDTETYPIGPVLELYHKETPKSIEDEYERLEMDSRILRDIKHVAAGRSHLLLVTNSNKIYAMGFNNYSQLGFKEEEQYIPRLRPVELPEKVSSVDGVAAGWFHSIILCDGGKIFSSGHSFFGQTFDVKMGSSFQRSNKMKFLERDNCKVNSVHTATFSSSLLVDGWKIYACGEMDANSNSSNYLVPGCDIFKQKESIKSVKHADKGIVVLTHKGNVYMANKDRGFHEIVQNVYSFVPSHMYETTYFLKNNSNILTECNLGPFSVRSNIDIGRFVQKYGLENIQICAGYCFYYLVVNKKRVYSINGTELKEILNLEGVSTSVLIKEVVSTSDCTYVVFERCISTASEKLMKTRLLKNQKHADLLITTQTTQLD